MSTLTLTQTVSKELPTTELYHTMGIFNKVYIYKLLSPYGELIGFEIKHKTAVLTHPFTSKELASVSNVNILLDSVIEIFFSAKNNKAAINELSSDLSEYAATKERLDRLWNSPEHQAKLKEIFKPFDHLFYISQALLLFAAGGSAIAVNYEQIINFLTSI